MSHVFSLGLVQVFAAALYQLRQEWKTTQEWAEKGIKLSTEQGGVTSVLAWGMTFRGWVLSEQGHGENSIAQLRQGIDAWRATGAEVGCTHFLALLAEAYGKAVLTEEGLTVLAEAFAQVNKTGERFYEAELYRLKGELTLQKLSVVSNQLSVTGP